MQPPPQTPLSPAETLVDSYFTPSVPQASLARKLCLLLIFCLAQFLDAFHNSALFSAIPQMTASLGFLPAEITWTFSAFQLTFASFLLISGRISDVYNPKNAFITGVVGLGILSLGAGFVQSKIALLILRALLGILASLTIPSALTLIVRIFPDPNEQARAIGVFGGCGAIGNVLGLTIGAIFVEFANWRWVFYFVAMVSLPVAAACVFLLPSSTSPTPSNVEEASKPAVKVGLAKFKSLDLIGVSILTVALILFIFAITSGSEGLWVSAEVFVPLFISIGLIAGFLYWETRVPADVAAVPPHTWKYRNFMPLFFLALLPYFWWTTIFLLYTTLWQTVYQWSVISTAIHMFPIGVLAFVMSFTGPFARSKIFGQSKGRGSKVLILVGLALAFIATMLLIFADSPDRYWSFVFPAFTLGSAGIMLLYTHTNIAIFQNSPPSQAGTVGAIFNGALQLGSAVGISAINSIETSVQTKPGEGGADGYQSRAASFYFVLAIIVVEAISVSVFFRLKHIEQAQADVEKKVRTSESDEKGVETPYTASPTRVPTPTEFQNVEEIRFAAPVPFPAPPVPAHLPLHE